MDGKLRNALKRYGFAMALPGLAVALRGVLPFPEGAGIYQLPLAAVVLSAWYGGRGPGFLSSAIALMGAMYLLPPADTFKVAADHFLPLSIFTALCLLLTEFSAGRRRIEHALRESEARFRKLTDLSVDGYWKQDENLRYIYSMDERHGFENRSLGKTRWELPFTPLSASWDEHRADLIARKPFHGFEYTRVHPDGTTRYISVSGVPMFDEQGEFKGYDGVASDITARKLAEAEHRAQVWFLESMDRINRAMQATNDLDRMMGDVLDAVLDVFGADRAWLLYPCDPDAPSWRPVMERTRPEFPGVAARGRDLPMTADSAEVARAALGSSAALPAGPGHQRQVKPQIAGEFGVQSEMLMALRPKGDQPYLFGLHQCSQPHSWTKHEQRLFEEVGHRLTDALGSLIALRGLRESEVRLEAAQRLARVGWWERDYATGHVSLSDEACRIFGVQPLELPQWHGRWLSLIHPEDRENAAAASDRALRGGPRYDIEYRVVRPDGAVRVVHSQGDVTREQSGRPVRQFGVMQDITELRRIEAELRARQELLDLAQKAASAVAFDWYIGAREKENRWSPELEQMYGLEAGTFDGTYQGWRKLIHPDDWPAVKAAIERAHESGDIAAEYRILHKDGAVHWLRAKGRMFFDAKGQPERMVGFMFDVTDWRHAEEALREKDNELEMARTELARVSRVTTLGELTASIAHEVNQPIGAMVTNAAACARWLAAKPPDMAEAQAALANIVADGKRAGEIITRIRALTRRQALRMELLDVNRKVRDVLALAAHELKTHGTVLRTELAPTLPGVAGDRVQLQQVLLNLIVNAIEAMGGVHDRARELTIATAAKEPGAVVVEVRDSGPGLDEESAERVFEAFYTTKAQGIGIGLSISRSIVEAHGGRLWATSNRPHGAVFRFSLPVVQEGAA